MPVLSNAVRKDAFVDTEDVRWFAFEPAPGCRYRIELTHPDGRTIDGRWSLQCYADHRNPLGEEREAQTGATLDLSTTFDAEHEGILIRVARTDDTDALAFDLRIERL